MDVRENINLLLEGVDSVEGYQTELIRRVREEINIHNLICIEKDHDGKDHLGDDVISINYDMCEHNQYLDKYDINTLLPLDNDILEAMRPYEATVMQMLIRNTEQDVYFYDECKQRYLLHLRFWNHMFVTYKINHVFQNCVPHHAHDYVIYALAKIHHCKYCGNVGTSVWNHWIPCDNLDHNSQTLLTRYEELKAENAEVVLSESLEHYYQALQIKNDSVDKNIMNRGMSKKTHMQMQKDKYRFYFSAKNRFKRGKHLLKEQLLAMTGKDDARKADIKNQVRMNASLSKRAKIRKRLMASVNYYDRLAGEPIAGEKFAIYFLHFQPEATTLPLAGAFVEQELAITLLAQALKEKGIVLYVKEHFVQPYRRKEFYDGLNNIDNVRLIRSDIDSKSLMTKSVAVSSCCGSSTQEAIINGIPVLLFGFCVFAGAPGTYECRTRADIDAALDSILAGTQIDQKNVRQYFKAFDEAAVKTDIYVSRRKASDTLFEDCRMDGLRDELVEFLK